MPRLFVLLFLLCVPLWGVSAERWAVIIVPVADGLGLGPPVKQSPTNAWKRYQTLPYSGSSTNQIPWLRQQQLLFNQIVKVAEEKAGECRVIVPQIMMQKSPERYPEPMSCWVLKSTLCDLQTLREKRLNPSNIPHPYPGIQIPKTVALIRPHSVRKTKTLFSAGTRFVLHSQDEKVYTVYILDSQKMKFDLIQLPKDACMLSQARSFEKRRDDFIELLHMWSSRQQGRFIPYVLGGSSWLYDYTEDAVSINEMKTKKGLPSFVFERKKSPRAAALRSGFDCTTLITTAAQICGLPLFAKNTTALAHMLAPLKKGERLEIGDILYMPGHVMIISSLKPLKLIQAEGYGERSQRGKVEEDSVENIFAKIETVNDLMRYYTHSLPLVPLSREKQRLRPLDNWKVLKLRSCQTFKAPNLDPYRSQL